MTYRHLLEEDIKEETNERTSELLIDVWLNPDQYFVAL